PCLSRSCFLRPLLSLSLSFVFFFNPPVSIEIYTLSLHDALPIFPGRRRGRAHRRGHRRAPWPADLRRPAAGPSVQLRLPALLGRSEEHTSELQSRFDLVCRLLLEKKNTIFIVWYLEIF